MPVRGVVLSLAATGPVAAFRRALNDDHPEGTDARVVFALP